MPIRKRKNTLENWEIALVKAMHNRGGYKDQDILAFFTRPTRSVNQGRLSEIRRGVRFRSIKAASDDELDEFLNNWPDLDAETGHGRRGDELLVKAREAMIAAVHIFNGVGLTFRSELFIVTSMIAWTYLLHAWFKCQGIDYRYKEADGSIKKTKEGADRYWDLSECLQHKRCPLPSGAAKNLKFILELRHEIEHRSTNRIDDALSAKLQACCLNFNNAIKRLFGSRCGLERRLPIALQFVTFETDQRTALKKGTDLPGNIETFIDAFENELSDEEYADPAYSYRAAFVPIAKNRVSGADVAIEFVKGDSEESREISRVLLKEVDRRRFTATQVWTMMQAEGFPKFNQHAHTMLWKELKAKDPGKGYGREGDYRKTWVWYYRWIERVRAHCQEQGDRYK